MLYFCSRLLNCAEVKFYCGLENNLDIDNFSVACCSSVQNLSFVPQGYEINCTELVDSSAVCCTELVECCVVFFTKFVEAVHCFPSRVCCTPTMEVV